MRNQLSNATARRWTFGTSFALSASQTEPVNDAWRFSTNANSPAVTLSRQAKIGDAGAYGVRIQRNVGQSGANNVVGFYEHAFSTDEIEALRGQQLTFSVPLHKGADFGGEVWLYVFSGTGTQSTRRAGPFTGEVTLGSAQFLAAAINGSRVSVTTSTAVPANATQLTAVVYVLSDTGTAGANDWVQVEVPQLETGTSVTDFGAAEPAVDDLRINRQIQRIPLALYVSGATSASQENGVGIPLGNMLSATPAATLPVGVSAGTVANVSVTYVDATMGRAYFQAGATGYCFGLGAVAQFAAPL